MKRKRYRSRVILDIDKAKDVRRKYRTKVEGLTTGIGLTTFMAGLFEANERKHRKHKLTDEMIFRLLVREFPHSKVIQRLLEGKDTIGYHRSKYNRGVYTQGEKPKPSRRYNEYGEIVNPRNGKRLTDKDIERLENKFGFSFRE